MCIVCKLFNLNRLSIKEAKIALNEISLLGNVPIDHIESVKQDLVKKANNEFLDAFEKFLNEEYSKFKETDEKH